MSKQTRGSLLLILTTMIWGAAFVAQQESMNYIGPFTMQATRFFLAGLVLMPVIALCDKKGFTVNPPATRAQKKRQLLCGIVCGVLLFVAATMQQFGLLYTSIGKSGFITALYVIFVPIIGVLLKQKVPLRIWLCALLALVGLYILCVPDAEALNLGDGLTLIAAVMFAVQIVYIGKVCTDLDGVRLSCVQSFTVSLLSVIGMVLTETPSLDAILACWLPICYAGILSSGVAYTLQIVGQQDVKPTLASIIMGLESVFAALFGWLIAGQSLSAIELTGCIIMFAANFLAQMPEKKRA